MTSLHHDLAVRNNTTTLANNGRSEVNLLANDGVIFVIRVIGVAKLAIGSELKFQELVAELTFVTHVISQVELAIVVFACHPLLCLQFLVSLVVYTLSNEAMGGRERIFSDQTTA